MKKSLFTVFILCSYVFALPQSLNIVFDGDSQTSSGTWPQKIIELLQSQGYTSVRYANFAVSGQTTFQMVSDVTSQVVPRYSSGYDENLVLYYIGYNDTWAGSNVDVTDLYNNLVKYYTTLKSAGFKVLMINLPDGINRSGISEINSMFASKNTALADVFVNCREPGGVFEDYTNTTWYRDNVHLSTTGLNYLAEKYVFPKLSELPDVVPQVPSGSALLTGLESYYKLDETSGNAKDETGSNPGVVSSSVTRTAGRVNGGYLFDGNTDYITFSKLSTLKTGTYSCWIRISSLNDDLLIMGNDSYYSRIFIGSNNNLKVETNTNGQEFAFYSPFALNTWYHIALVRNNDNVTFYRNGISLGTSSISGSANMSLRQIGFNGRSFRGVIDEVGIWSRALTSQEVALVYNSAYPFSGTLSVPPTPPVIDAGPISSSSLLTSLKAYYKFDETSGNARDEAGGNTGYVSAGVTKVAGRVNGGFHFDSNSDYVTLSNPLTHKTATYSFWMKIQSITDDLIIMGHNAYYSRIFIGANNNIKIETNTNGQEFDFYNTFTTGTWHHITLVRENDQMRLYRNGIHIGATSISGSNSLTISQIGFNGRSFRGTLDEVGIWDRALTAGEIALLNSGQTYPFSSLKSTNLPEEPEEINELTFYPNPAGEMIHLNQTYSSICVYDLHGRQVIRKTNQDYLEVSGLTGGIYILEANDNGKIFRSKVVHP
ncbi:MAG TPA: LamG-like jellyroll fold domain-containing protein [Bacteroidales bacterium]|nr:LamG-like jellyroll fold domain-containing protein [Bacteroidales bacterium]